MYFLPYHWRSMMIVIDFLVYFWVILFRLVWDLFDLDYSMIYYLISNWIKYIIIIKNWSFKMKDLLFSNIFHDNTFSILLYSIQANYLILNFRFQSLSFFTITIFNFDFKIIIYFIRTNYAIILNMTELSCNFIKYQN